MECKLSYCIGVSHEKWGIPRLEVDISIDVINVNVVNQCKN